MRIAAAALLLAACTAADPTGRASQPVIDGIPVEPGDYPATVALVAQGFGGFFCTGTLIAPTVVLTAGHCLEGLGEVPGITRLIDANTVDEADVVPGLAAYPHPDFDLDAAISAGLAQFNDVGVLVLAEAVDDVEPEIVATPAEAAELLVPGATIELVGYGVSDEAAGTAGIKLKGTASLRDKNDWELLLSEPGQQQNCFGDSGGPGFIAIAGGGRRLVGVVSRGPDPESFACDIGGIDTRADAYLDWIASVLAGHDAGPVGAPDASVPDGSGDAGPGADGGGDAGCCAVVGRRRPAGPGALALAALGLVALVRLRRRSM